MTPDLTETTALRNAEQTARAAAAKAMSDRGIDNPDELLEFNAPATILAWCRWFDGQRDVGAGVLAARIRSGHDAPRLSTRTTEAQQEAYLGDVLAWLRRHFPDLTVELGWPHNAAIVEVLHLHQQHGKGGITARQHGPQIRAAVRAWNAKHNDQAAT